MCLWRFYFRLSTNIILQKLICKHYCDVKGGGCDKGDGVLFPFSHCLIPPLPRWAGYDLYLLPRSDFVLLAAAWEGRIDRSNCQQKGKAASRQNVKWIILKISSLKIDISYQDYDHALSRKFSFRCLSGRLLTRWLILPRKRLGSCPCGYSFVRVCSWGFCAPSRSHYSTEKCTFWWT